MGQVVVDVLNGFVVELVYEVPYHSFLGGLVQVPEEHVRVEIFRLKQV